MMKRLVSGCILTAGLVLSGGGIANAGEVNGKGEVIPGADMGASECAFSGLDTADPLEEQPPEFDDDVLATRGNQSPAGVDRYHGVQSYGIYARAGLKGVVPSPGMACRGG